MRCCMLPTNDRYHPVPTSIPSQAMVRLGAKPEAPAFNHGLPLSADTGHRPALPQAAQVDPKRSLAPSTDLRCSCPDGSRKPRETALALQLRRRGCGSRGLSKYLRKPSLPVWCRTATLLIVHARLCHNAPVSNLQFALVETTTIQTGMLIGTSKVLRHVTIAFSRLEIMIPARTPCDRSDLARTLSCNARTVVTRSCHEA